jgi:hypothetical protein
MSIYRIKEDLAKGLSIDIQIQTPSEERWITLKEENNEITANFFYNKKYVVKDLDKLLSMFGNNLVYGKHLNVETTLYQLEKILQYLTE